MAFVPDASVAAAWVLPDEEAAVADLALDRLGEETAKVPGVFWHELRNLLLSAERRRRIDVHHAEASMTRLRRLRIHLAEESDDREVMALARAHRLTADDASYLACCATIKMACHPVCRAILALAIRENCALANLDRHLNEAAAAEGMELFV